MQVRFHTFISFFFSLKIIYFTIQILSFLQMTGKSLGKTLTYQIKLNLKLFPTFFPFSSKNSWNRDTWKKECYDFVIFYQRINRSNCQNVLNLLMILRQNASKIVARFIINNSRPTGTLCRGKVTLCWKSFKKRQKR